MSAHAHAHDNAPLRWSSFARPAFAPGPAAFAAVDVFLREANAVFDAFAERVETVAAAMRGEGPAGLDEFERQWHEAQAWLGRRLTRLSRAATHADRLLCAAPVALDEVNRRIQIECLCARIECLALSTAHESAEALRDLYVRCQAVRDDLRRL
jgi:hypothetical protein